MKKKIIVGIFLLTLLSGGYFALSRFLTSKRNDKTQQDRPAQTSQSSPVAGFNKATFSATDPNSIWVIVNKQHPIVPANFKPSNLVLPTVPQRVPGSESMQLRADTAAALKQLVDAAAKDNLQLMLSSGYRSYDYQINLYAGYVRTLGQDGADKISARPGHSEHQTGLALDIEPASKNCEIVQCFADTPEGKWVKEQSYKYGFIVRYTPDKVAVTGYASEPWHLRYVGTELATELHNHGIQTLEEFFGISGGESY